MSCPQPYQLMIKTITRSKARFLKFFPMKSFVEGEEYEISFELENIGGEVFPGGEIYFEITWPSLQSVKHHFPILPLKRNEKCNTPKFLTEALCDGYGLVRISRPCNVMDEQDKIRNVEFYSGKRVEDHMPTPGSIASIKSKSWEEIYEFSALIVATISLAIIALEKILWLIRWII